MIPIGYATVLEALSFIKAELPKYPGDDDAMQVFTYLVENGSLPVFVQPSSFLGEREEIYRVPGEDLGRLLACDEWSGVLLHEGRWPEKPLPKDEDFEEWVYGPLRHTDSYAGARFLVREEHLTIIFLRTMQYLSSSPALPVARPACTSFSPSMHAEARRKKARARLALKRARPRSKKKRLLGRWLLNLPRPRQTQYRSKTILPKKKPVWLDG
jgi:hypothetical protein